MTGKAVCFLFLLGLGACAKRQNLVAERATLLKSHRVFKDVASKAQDDGPEMCKEAIQPLLDQISQGAGAMDQAVAGSNATLKAATGGDGIEMAALLGAAASDLGNRPSNIPTGVSSDALSASVQPTVPTADSPAELNPPVPIAARSPSGSDGFSDRAENPSPNQGVLTHANFPTAGSVGLPPRPRAQPEVRGSNPESPSQGGRAAAVPFRPGLPPATDTLKGVTVGGVAVAGDAAGVSVLPSRGGVESQTAAIHSYNVSGSSLRPSRAPAGLASAHAPLGIAPRFGANIFQVVSSTYQVLSKRAHPR